MTLDLTEWDGDVNTLIRTIRRSDDVAALDRLANQASKTGATRTALGYVAAYRIYEIYHHVEQTSDRVLKRHLRRRGYAYPSTGATGLRRYYCSVLHGWESFNAWLVDWVSGAPISRSSAWHKMWDIEGWRKEGASWDTILKLLANTPMAGRDALNKPVQPEALPPGGKAQYLDELTELSPGQARKKVSEDSGEMQICLLDAQWHKGSLLLKVMQETSEGMENYDLIIRQVSDGPWLAVAHWLTGKLGRRLLIG